MINNKKNNGNYQRVTNLEYLNSISNGNIRFIREMIRTFLTEVPREMNNLEAAIINTNFEIIRQVAHKLKSTIIFVGLDKLIKDEVGEMEQLAKQHSGIDRIKSLFGKVKDIFTRAVDELNE